MKKYLLGLLAIPFSLIAFSNAEIVNVSCPFQEECTPNQLNISPDNCIDGIIQFSFSNLSCVLNENSDTEDLSCGLGFSSEDGSWYDIVFEDGQLVDSTCYIGGDDTLFAINSTNPEFDFEVNLNIGNSNTGGGDIGGGDSGESGELIGQLTPIIDGLGSAMSEFIPYVVYIGLGILGVIIGFVAIKWLMRWVKGKSLGTFNSRRRK